MDLKNSLTQLDASALVVLSRHGSAEPDMGRYLSGAHIGEVLLVWPREGAPLLLPFTNMEREEAARSGLTVLDPEQLGLGALQRAGSPPEAIWARAVLAALEVAGAPKGRVAVAGSGAAAVLVELTRLLEKEGVFFVSGAELAAELRRSKTVEELREVERVTQIVQRAFVEVARLLVAATPDAEGQLWRGGERLRVGHLREAVRGVFCRAALSEPKGNILAPGRQGGVPHNAGEDVLVLAAGETLVVDLFPRGALFSDVTRTFLVGPVPDALRKAHAAVVRALELAHEGLKPGVRGWDLQEAVCAYFRSQGYPEPIGSPGTTVGYVHNLGHGVGYELHEAPSFRAVTGSQGVLAVGDVVTLEPGLYDPGAGGFGLRLEDLVVVEEAGPRCLTPWTYDLDPKVFLEGIQVC